MAVAQRDIEATKQTIDGFARSGPGLVGGRARRTVATPDARNFLLEISRSWLARRMATKQDLADWIIDALRARGGSASVVEVCREIWQRHEPDLRSSGDMFFTWQYDVRWEAQKLRDSGRLASAAGRRGASWSLP